MTEPAASLTSRIVKSAGWVFLGRLVNRGFEFMKAVVLARLLGPEDFGLFALVMLCVLSFDIFSQTGVSAALIRKRDLVAQDLETAWTIQLLRGTVLAFGVYLAAPLVGHFFEDQRVMVLIRVMALVPLIQGLYNVHMIHFERDLRFRKQFIYEMSSGVCSLIVGIFLALRFRSVWALVWANIALVFSRLVLSYTLESRRPRLRFRARETLELFRFGRWMAGYSISLFLWQQMDKIVLGKLLGPAALGIYQIAQRVADLPASQLAVATVGFTLPAYAKLQDSRERLGQAFLDIWETVLSLVFPLAGFIFLAAPDIVLGLLGARWQGAIVPMRLLAVLTLLNAMDAMATPVFVSVGMPKEEFRRSTMKVLILSVSIVPLALGFGVNGVCCALMLASVAALPIWARLLEVTEVSWRQLMARMGAPVALAISVMVAVGAVQQVHAVRGVFSLVGCIVASALGYALAALVLGKVGGRGIYVLALRAKSSLTRSQ